MDNIILEFTEVSKLKDINTLGTTILFATSKTSPSYFTRELHLIDGEIKN